MKRMNIPLKCVLIALTWLFYTQAFSQNVKVNFASNRDSVGIEGEIVRIPILLDTVHTLSMIDENIIALNLTFSHSAELTPQAFDFATGLIETWSINTVISDNNSFSVTAAGVSPIALDSGLLFYVDFLLGDVVNVSNPTYHLSTSADNYFNEGGYDFTMDYGQIKINPILALSVSASPTRITKKDSTRIHVSGGTAPYTYALVDPTFGSFVSEDYFLSEKSGFAEIVATDLNGIEGNVTVEVRPFELDIKGSEDEVLPGDDFMLYVTTTDISDLDIISGSFSFSHGNNSDIQFLNADATGYLLEAYSIEVDRIDNNFYQLVFAGTTAVGVGDTLLALNFSLSEAPANSNEHISIRDNTIVFNEDLLGNRGSGTPIRYIDLIQPTISFPSGKYVVGDQVQFSSTGGTEPYTWSTSDASIGSIDQLGLLSVLKGGKLTVKVTDNFGVESESVIELFDGILDIANHSAAAGTEYLLPIEITNLPAGRGFNSFALEFTYDPTVIKYLGAVKTGSLTEDFTVVENTITDVRSRIVGANTTEIIEAGDFIYLKFLLENLAENASTSITLNEVILNEGEPVVITENGSIKAALSPTTSDVTLTIDEDELYAFSATNFPFDHPDVDRIFQTVKFLSLPETGSFNYFGSPVTLNQHISVSSLDNLTYQGDLNESAVNYASFDFVVIDDANVSSNYPATMTIDVTSVNDAPSFTMSQNNVSVDEDFTDPVIIQLTMDDAPSNELGETVTYSIAPETLDFADVVFNQGNLTLTFNSISNAFGSENITITADDGQSTNNTFNQVLGVAVNSVNDAPEFSDQSFTIQENLAAGTEVGLLVVNDIEHTNFVFSITSGNTDAAFAINNATHKIEVANVSAIDFETNPSFILSVDVSDGDAITNATISITLTDVDESVNQAPQIVAQTFAIDENSANGTSVGTVIASDPETDVITYSITAGNANNAFALDAASGVLTVADISQLDFETTPSFSLTVQVADAALNASATITVNLNDVDESVNQAPQIVAQTFAIDENSANGTSVGTVIASDPDSDVLTYSITGGNTNNAFALDASSGVLTVADISQLDFETTPSFSLTIQVADAALNASATITVNLNDVNESVNQAPQIVAQTFAIDENSANGTSIGTVVASDPDNDVLTYSITGGNTSNAFALDAASGVLTVADVSQLDFETTPSFSLTVQVADAALNASATITVNLNDVDESVNQAPQIVAQTFSIDENSANGTSIGTVVASDPDNDVLTYSITGGNTNNAFALDASTGALIVADVSQLDFETTPSFSLTVQVADAALNTSATITVNLNDVDESVNQAPQIVAQTFAIDENSANGTSVGTVVASDPDGDVIAYSITAGNTNNAFALDAASGDLTVADVSQLDFETTPSFSLTIQVADAALNASAIVTVNLNDVDESVNQAPQIVAQTFAIDENSANGTSVGTVIASDPDNDVLTYSITGGNTNNAFALDASSGVLTVADVSHLDFETTPSFSLTVQVADAALNASATITVNLNDVDESVNQAPQIVAQTFSLDENSANGTSVGNVVASDPDGDAITYSITAGNTSNAFALDASTGVLTVADVSQLDFETTPSFSLTVQVADAALNASATITVNLNDVDESVNQAPQIVAQTFSIDENSANGTSIGTVVASDPDNDVLTYSITGGNTNNAFALDASSGALTVADVSQLDFETTPSFSLTVQVADAALNASATITVNLNDVDESVNQAPQIVAQTFAIDENSANGTSVGNVVASDPDGDAITYSITAGNTSNAFALDASTGVLTVADVAQLDFETTPSFSLTVQVADAALNASATITVNLNDVNENNAPTITNQSFTVIENSDGGTVIGTVQASDVDGDALNYSITGGNTDNAFAIGNANGELIVVSSSALDFANNPTFNLTVVVNDGQDNASATITITVEESTVTSIEDLSKSGVYLYPNPAVNSITLKNISDFQIEKMELIDMAGKRLELTYQDGHEISIDFIKSGFYQLLIYRKDGIILRGKFMKN